MKQYEDVITKALDLIGWVYNKSNKLISKFKKYLAKYAHDKLGIRTEQIVKSIKAAEDTPRGHYSVKPKPVKFIFKDSLDSELYQDIAALQVYLKDHSYLDLSQNYFVTRKKREAANVCNAFIEHQYKTVDYVNKVIDKDILVDNLFTLESLDYQEYKELPKEVKLVLKEKEE